MCAPDRTVASCRAAAAAAALVAAVRLAATTTTESRTGTMSTAGDAASFVGGHVDHTDRWHAAHRRWWPST